MRKLPRPPVEQHWLVLNEKGASAHIFDYRYHKRTDRFYFGPKSLCGWDRDEEIIPADITKMPMCEKCLNALEKRNRFKRKFGFTEVGPVGSR